MIQSFRSLELAAGSANASILAGGIWQALLTTAAGLTAAIPSFIGYRLLVARIDRLALELEDASGEVIRAIVRQRRS
jgi:biopolymer transport protein ExbB